MQENHMHITSEQGEDVGGITPPPAGSLVIEQTKYQASLKEQHENLIKALNDDIRKKVPIDASQFVTYNPVGGVFMPFSEQQKQQAVDTIANTAPSIISLLFRKHWVTSALGVVAIVPQILVASGVDLGGWAGIVSAVASGVGLVFAKSATAK